MATVSNTSPISNLSIIGRLNLLQSQFGVVLIPDAVRAELERIPDTGAKALIDQALADGWLRVRTAGNTQLATALGNDLDAGESEAIALAAELQADILLIDEREGRNFARLAGLRVRGVLGVLIRAKALGEIALVKPEIDALRGRAGFFIAPSLESEVLLSVGE